MHKIASFINHFNEKIGNAISWLTSILVWVICLDVVLRYFFNLSWSGLFELEWHLFALLFLLGAASTLTADKHVRVDVFYSKFSEKGKAWVNLIGTVVFLMPLCWVVIKSSIPFVMNSYEIMEGSPDPGGLPFRFIVKSAIPIGFFLLMLQGISLMLTSLLTIQGKQLKDV
ncbi:MAG: TRAP transporter small permease subunit [Cyclobacteriaceae bacterium]